MIAISERQLEAIQHTSQGMQQKEIALRMNCSIKNVKNLLSEARFKMNARNTLEVVAKAAKAGLICFLIASFATDIDSKNIRSRKNLRFRSTKELITG
ncbi:response regulator transcription factor [Marinibactrum halimedae]|uniref:HTH luxR-type domain-containing protein n=1 Tax=Marinibactrum halimedae TaxID=1444977 RepID=A0AA37TAD8_9GAMM|nr:helix-turn-helix transcriptional regulator [Marinibactrum halimedae]MCD9458915.1 helix-turn-helix transcriptional regulator [Marinibactrum halimedae]GLS27763.1 hypothetical protein GCM10007877_34820 [Marinibactrum halimedae]